MEEPTVGFYRACLGNRRVGHRTPTFESKSSELQIAHFQCASSIIVKMCQPPHLGARSHRISSYSYSVRRGGRYSVKRYSYSTAVWPAAMPIVDRSDQPQSSAHRLRTHATQSAQTSIGI
jgi:hypothetical protein